ncbi:MAG: nodulation protein NfeD [Candidatus Omnitrophota bacterium]|nr:MAG: nodulation protein NfeD [Candidatus Omnitrophota bacterium]
MSKRIYLFIFIIPVVVFLAFTTVASSQERSEAVYLVTIDDYIINPVVEEYISNAIRSAQRDGQCLIIQLDTPGGLLSSTRKIVKEIMASKVPVAVYVSPKGARAGSAGVFITISSHIAAMAPSTNIGAAHPVQMGERKSISDVIKEIIKYFKKTDEDKAQKKKKVEPVKEEKDIMSEKIMSDTLAWVSTIARTRKRNVDWARKAVLESASVTETEAKDLGVIDLVAEDIDDLLIKINGRRIKMDDKVYKLATKDAKIVKIDLDKRQQFLNVVTNPTIAYILMILGFYGLLFEFTHPGIGFPGIAGTIAIILGFYGLHTLPTNYAGVALIILAFILFIAEMQVQGFGLLALGGIISMVLGSVILIDSPYAFMRISIKVIIPVVVATAAITTFLAAVVIRTHRRRVKTGAEGLIGEQGKVIKGLKPKGKVFMHGEVWNAVSEEPVNKGETVEVIRVEGMRLMVKKI